VVDVRGRSRTYAIVHWSGRCVFDLMMSSSVLLSVTSRFISIADAATAVIKLSESCLTPNAPMREHNACNSVVSVYSSALNPRSDWSEGRWHRALRACDTTMPPWGTSLSNRLR
jgi:hypothetical protein